MVIFDQGVTTQGDQSLKHAPISEETGVEAGQGVEPSPGPGKCRPLSYLPHTQNSSEIPKGWTDTLEVSSA